MPGNQRIHLCDHKGAALAAIRKHKVQLLYKFIQLIKIKPRILRNIIFHISGQLGENNFRCLPVPGIIKLLTLSDYNIGGLTSNPGIYLLQIFLIRKPGRILGNLIL